MVLRYADVTIKTSKVDYIFFPLVITYLGSATIFTRGGLESFGGFTVTTVVGKFCMLFYVMCIFYEHGNRMSISMPWKIVLILMIWTVFQAVKYETLSINVLMRLMNLFFAVVIIKVYGMRTIYLFEDIIVKVALISLIGWCLVLFLPNMMLNIASLSPIEEYGLVRNGSLVSMSKYSA